MTLTEFPNEYLEVLIWVITDHPEDYTLISCTANGHSHMDIEIDGINTPFDLLALGVRIGMNHADKTTIERVVPSVIDIVRKDLDSKVEHSEN